MAPFYSIQLIPDCSCHSFYLAQLAPFNYFDPNGTALPVFWETQERFSRAHAPFTGHAVLIDVGELDDIHPKDKRPVAKRLAQCRYRKYFQ